MHNLLHLPNVLDPKDDFMKFYGILLSLYLLSFGHVFAQQTAPTTSYSFDDLPALEDSLAVYAYGVLKDTNENRRFYSCKELILGLKRALIVPNSFDYSFSKLKSVSIQYPQDSSFRIFTWQLYVNKDEYRTIKETKDSRNCAGDT